MVDMWAAYRQVAQAFAETVREVYEEGDMIWVHGYHLMLVPDLIRHLIPGATIGFSLHLPFPTSEIFRVLPWRQNILEGILAADVIGFQTFHHSRHFVRACTRVLGIDSKPLEVKYRGHLARLLICPVGVDLRRIGVLQRRRAVRDRRAVLKKRFERRFVIVGLDRCVQTSGIVQKLMAFEEFLISNPKLCENVMLVQIVLPTNPKLVSRQNKNLRARIDQIVGRCNARFARITSSQKPIYCLHQALASDDLCALYETADAVFVTPTIEGMNLVPFEYLVCRENRGIPGTVIVSEFAGCASSLSGALIVNPASTDGMAMAITEALIMDEEERCERHAHMIGAATTFTAAHWLHTNTDLLERILTMRKEGASARGELEILSLTALINAMLVDDREKMLGNHTEFLLPLEPESKDELVGDAATGMSLEAVMRDAVRDAVPRAFSDGGVNDSSSSSSGGGFGGFGGGGGGGGSGSNLSNKNDDDLEQVQAMRIAQTLTEMHLVVVDFEDVLVAAQSMAELVSLPSDVRTNIMKLCSSVNVRVLVLSTRPRELIARMLEGVPCWIAAEHGYVVRLGWAGDGQVEECRQWKVVPSDAGAIANQGWLDICGQIFRHYGRRTPGAVLETTPVSISLRMEEADREYATSIARQLLSTLSETTGGLPIKAHLGHNRVDVIHVAVDKGAAVALALAHLEEMIGDGENYSSVDAAFEDSEAKTEYAPVAVTGGAAIVSGISGVKVDGRHVDGEHDNQIVGVKRKVCTVLCILTGKESTDENVFTLLKDLCDVAVVRGDKLTSAVSAGGSGAAGPGASPAMAEGPATPRSSGGMYIKEGSQTPVDSVHANSASGIGSNSDGLAFPAAAGEIESAPHLNSILTPPTLKSQGYVGLVEESFGLRSSGASGTFNTGHEPRSGQKPLAVLCTMKSQATALTTGATFSLQGMDEVHQVVEALAENVAMLFDVKI